MKEITTDKKSFDKDSSSQIIYKYLKNKISNDDSSFARKLSFARKIKILHVYS